MLIPAHLPLGLPLTASAPRGLGVDGTEGRWALRSEFVFHPFCTLLYGLPLGPGERLVINDETPLNPSGALVVGRRFVLEAGYVDGGRWG